MADDEGQGPGPVPYDQFQRRVRELRAAEEKIGTLQGEIEKLRAAAAVDEETRKLAAAAPKLEAQVAELTGKLTEHEQAAQQFAAERTVWGEERAMFAAGLLADEARVVARALYTATPEQDRPTLGEWLSGITAEPEKAPIALRGYLGAMQATAGLPRTTSGVRQTQVPNAEANAASLRAVRERAQSGDRAALEELRAMLGKA